MRQGGGAAAQSPAAAGADTKGSSSALPAGTVASIAIGASLAAAALAGGAWLLLRRRAQPRRVLLEGAPLPGKSALDSSAPSGAPSAQPWGDGAAGGPAMVHHNGELWSVAVDPPSPQPLQSPFSALAYTPARRSPSGSAGGSSSGGGALAQPRADAAAAAGHWRPPSAAQPPASMPGPKPVPRSGSAPMLARPPRPPPAAQLQPQPRTRTGLPPLPASGSALHLPSSGLLQSSTPSAGRAGLGAASSCGAWAAPKLSASTAEQEASAILARLSRGSSELGESQQLATEGLPPRLREWLIDPSEVELLRRPDGSLVELGSGARWAALAAGGSL